MKPSVFALLLLCASAASAQQITGYFGPEKGTIADPREQGEPTIIFQESQPDGGPAVTVCLLIVNPYGPNAGGPYVEVSTQLVNGALRIPGGVFIDPAGPINCRLLFPGECVSIQGHTVSPPDQFQQSWIVDSFSLPLRCP